MTASHSNFLHSPDPLIFLSTDSDDVQTWISTTTCFSLGWPGDAECHWLEWSTHVWTQLSWASCLTPNPLSCSSWLPFLFPAAMTLSLVFIARHSTRLLPSLSLLRSKWSVSLRKLRSLSMNSFIFALKSPFLPYFCPPPVPQISNILVFSRTPLCQKSPWIMPCH